MAEGDHVTQKQFYETMTASTEKIVAKIDGVKTEMANLSREMGEIKKCVESNTNRIGGCEDEIGDLVKSDKKITTIATVIATTISATFTMIVDSIRRN